MSEFMQEQGFSRVVSNTAQDGGAIRVYSWGLRFPRVFCELFAETQRANAYIKNGIVAIRPEKYGSMKVDNSQRCIYSASFSRWLTNRSGKKDLAHFNPWVKDGIIFFNIQ